MTGGFTAAVSIAASVGVGLVHLALGPEHLEELGPLGWGFYLAAALQIGWAVTVLAVLVAPSRRGTDGDARRSRLAVAGIVINVAILGAWAIARTVGLPAGETPWVPEQIGRVDTITALLEVAIVVALVGRLRSPRVAAPRLPRLATALAVVVIAVGTAVALVPDASHADGHDAMSGAMDESMVHSMSGEMSGADSAP